MSVIWGYYARLIEVMWTLDKHLLFQQGHFSNEEHSFTWKREKMFDRKIP